MDHQQNDDRSPSSQQSAGSTSTGESKPHLFVNISHPREASTDAVRRAVRSYVASEPGSALRTGDGAARPRGRRKKRPKPPTLELETSDLIPTADSAPSSHLGTPSATGSPLSAPALGAGRTDPFITFPVPYHPSLALLIDYYLTCLAPADAKEEETSFRGQLRTYWWPEVLSHSGLFQATLLTAASHQSDTRNAPLNDVLVQWLKSNAITAINSAMADPELQLQDATIGAVATLGAWEFLHGDADAYRMHMRGLQTMVGMRGDLASAGMSQILVRLVQSAAHDLANFDTNGPYLPNVHTSPTDGPSKMSLNPTSSLAPGFARLEAIGVLLQPILHAIRHFTDLNLSGTDVGPQHLSQFLAYIMYWAKHTLAAGFCPFESDADDQVLLYIHRYIAVAVVACVRLLVQSRGLPAERVSGLERERIRQMADSLDAAGLVKTIYAESLFWAVFMIQTALDEPEPKLLEILFDLSRTLGLRRWNPAQRLLHSFLPLPHFLDHRGPQTWALVVSHARNVAPGSSPLGGSLSPASGSSLGPESITRYARDNAAIAFPDLDFPFMDGEEED